MESPTPATARTIAIVLYPDLTALDLVGPLQVLSAFAAITPGYRVVVVAEGLDAVRTDVPVGLAASATFADEPRPFALLVPGGRAGTIRALSSPVIRRYVRTAADSADWVTSVCTGSLILGAVGLLEGRPASTNWFFSSLLGHFGAEYRHERWVHDGRLLTSAGVSAGIDMALYLVAALTDEATARRVQAILDYDPTPPFGPIDWARVDRPARALRAGIRVAAPLLVRKARRTSAAEARATRNAPAPA